MIEEYIVSISSNFDAEININKFKHITKQIFNNVSFASVLFTKPVGKGYPKFDYINTAVKFTSDMDKDTLCAKLKDIEQLFGRTLEMREKKIVPIDLDIICHNGEVIHKDYERFSFTHKLVDELLK